VAASHSSDTSVPPVSITRFPPSLSPKASHTVVVVVVLVFLFPTTISRLHSPPLRVSRIQTLANQVMGGERPPPISGGGAFAFISKGWREVRDSASADLRQMRARADRELEHLLASASALAGRPLPPVAAGAPIAEVEFVRKRIQPKIMELRRQYSSTVRDAGWAPKAAGASLRVDLSGITAIRNAIVAEGGGGGGGGGRWGLVQWKGHADDEGRKEWEVVRMIRSGLKEFERRSLSSEVFGGFRGRGEFVEKFKLSLVIRKFHLKS
jgi:digalactosyldiacylglycerol synthase